MALFLDSNAFWFRVSDDQLLTDTYFQYQQSNLTTDVTKPTIAQINVAQFTWQSVTGSDDIGTSLSDGLFTLKYQGMSYQFYWSQIDFTAGMFGNPTTDPATDAAIIVENLFRLA